MEIQSHILTMFEYLQPEVLLAALVKRRDQNNLGAQGTPFYVNGRAVSMECYTHGARNAFPERSDDELRQFYWELEDFLNSKPTGGILSLPALYGRQMLRLGNGDPLCHVETLLEWRQLSLDLGQDLLVCATLAQRDAENHCVRNDFCWPIAVRTDDQSLKNLLEQGLAENHFHLYGSTQGFPVTWSFLMNHPEQAGRYFSLVRFQDNLHSSGSWGVRDNALPWKTRIYYAAWLRALLFAQLKTNGQAVDITPNAKKNFSLSAFYLAMNKESVVRKMVETIRTLYGTRLRQKGGASYCLDYAVPPMVDQSKPTRLLSGERWFLYECFRRCCTNSFSPVQQDLFYLYLLLKQSFRGEIVQTNRRYGFRNFSSYTNRKDLLWGNRNEYWFEAVRLAINATLEPEIHSLEMRIVPGRTAEEMLARVEQPDLIYQDTLEGTPERRIQRRQRAILDDRTFYVVHFTKKPLPRIKTPINQLHMYPRHGAHRRLVEQQAKAVASSLERSSYMCSRIRGIDAASHEIGCRPEIFATAFRFLRQFPVHVHLAVQQQRYWPTLGASYHAGEDFLDVTDGLRAIDEAVCFLDLMRGDRLGHALALGVEPEDFYRLKKHRVVMPAQDLLDNLVWLLFRCLEWGVSMSSDLRNRLKNRAESLLREIYGFGCPNVTLQEYYQSWMLRGDAPELYRSQDNDNDVFERQLSKMRCGLSRYDFFRINDHIWSGIDINDCRASNSVRKLIYFYQYDRTVRLLGQKIHSYEVQPDYIRLVRRVQNCMMQRLMVHGICIECNPSSNFLIGTFRQYEKHPIFRFNGHNLALPGLTSSHAQLQVSINTDDQSVFDTSLEYEYALLYCSMSKHKDEEGLQLISNDTAGQYLDHVRNMSISMTFAKADNQLRYHSLY